MIYMTELDNQNYDLSQLTQRIFTKYYLQPFSSEVNTVQRDIDPKHYEITDARIPRVTHGAMHAARVTGYVKIIHLFRQDQFDPVIYKLVEFTRAFNLSMVQIIHLTQIAALFHDVSRENEGIDHWDKESANACLNFLKTEIDSLPDCIAHLIANTISFKDHKHGFLNEAISLGLTNEMATAADYLRELVHDADCLDVMRVRKTFKMQFLDMVNAPGLQHATEKISNLVKDVLGLINLHGDQLFNCVIKMQSETLFEKKLNFDITLKCDYEWVENVYNKIIYDMKGFQNLSNIERPLQNELTAAIPNMYYPFNSCLLSEIKQAFMFASIISEQVESSCPDSRDYLFIKFQNPVITSFTNSHPQVDKDVVAIIFSGDAELSKQCSRSIKDSGGGIELGFRWFGIYDGTKGVEISGFSLKIIYPGNKFALRESIFEMVCRELENANLIINQAHYKDRLLSLTSELPSSSQLSMPCFFKPKHIPTIDEHQLDAMASYISENIPSIPAMYIRPNELSINPTYQNVGVINRKLELNQKKIWLLRSDFILAVGNKNSNWTNFKDTGLPDAIDTAMHAYVNWEDRYGHPSLAIPHTGYDGSVFYGGYLSQRNGFIEIYTFSGRYHRHDLDDQKKVILEAYIAHHFQNTYGDQPVVFIDAVAFGPAVLDNFELSIFISNNSLPEYCIRRPYTRETIKSVLDGMPKLNAQPNCTV